MKINRIYAMVLRYFYYFRHSLDRMSDAFYWPTVDLLLWGLTSAYFKQYTPLNSKVILMIVSGILLWIVVWRGQYEITVNLLEEIWNRNLINLFGSPLKFSEWIVTVLIVGIIKAFLSLGFAIIIAFLLYRVKIFYLGFYFLPFIFLLIITGWWVGFLVAGVILRFGTKVQTFAWTAIMIIAPFSAIYYPLSVLPPWAQKVAAFVPTSYVFEGARKLLNQGKVDYLDLIFSFILNIIYLLLALVFLRQSYKKVLNKGLIKVF
ncbi:MAG: ABC transporter permease [Microgenomates group bacterium]|nr:ABC transporter permease [Microgenomates group bacterium]